SERRHPPSERRAAVSGGEVVAWCELTPSGKIAFFDGKPMVMAGPVGNEHHTTPLVLQSDLDAAIAERDKLRSLCACAYQMAGYHDAPVKWLDAFGDAASGTPLSEWRLQANDLGDALLPYSPDTESPEAAIARAEAAERDRSEEHTSE